MKAKGYKGKSKNLFRKLKYKSSEKAGGSVPLEKILCSRLEGVSHEKEAKEKADFYKYLKYSPHFSRLTLSL
ncbi:hypothetical protein E2C01_022075 [Portunus trituberculatus]|uniref:Uncharacterized protein n=1 Tax=Portunus trituberculatus TaxID=210409 RepID=A0A5B7E491_PORTR|nr:hypothetical protein [Portunus trituberculatus]